MKTPVFSRTLKIIAAVLVLALCLLAVSCSDEGSGAEPATSEEAEQAAENGSAAGETADDSGEKGEMIDMTLMINDEEVSVIWEDNESVRALAELASAAPLTIETSRYGGFEQVGSLGTTLPDDDTDIRTQAGDIMLYAGSNIVIFFGSNSWAYTRLGRIEGKSGDELEKLLGGSGTVLTITAD